VTLLSRTGDTIVNKPQMTFMQACRDFFGLKEGQTAMQFGQEVKALTEDDRKEITAGLQAQGYSIVAATLAK
jgi:hypothetical protein